MLQVVLTDMDSLASIFLYNFWKSIAIETFSIFESLLTRQT